MSQPLLPLWDGPQLGEESVREWSNSASWAGRAARVDQVAWMVMVDPGCSPESDPALPWRWAAWGPTSGIDHGVVATREEAIAIAKARAVGLGP